MTLLRPIAVDLDSGSSNCAIAAPLRVTLRFDTTAAAAGALPAASLLWEAGYIADVAAANLLVPVFGPTVPSPAAGAMSPCSIAATVDPALSAARLFMSRGGAFALTLAEIKDGSEIASVYCTPGAAAEASPSDSASSLVQACEESLSISVENMGALFDAIPEKYMLQVGLLQFACYATLDGGGVVGAAGPLPSGVDTSNLRRVGEVNIMCQMKKSSANSTTDGGTGTTRCFYSTFV